MTETRARIIAATNELFRVHGYNGTSLSQISKASGATIGSIYHFFPGGKDELTASVLASTGAAYRELFEAIAAEDLEIGTAFAAFFEGAAATLAAGDFVDPCPIGTVAREVASTNDDIRRAAAAVFDSWVDAAVRRFSCGGISDDVARDLAIGFVATVEGGFVLSRTLRSVEPMLAAGRGFVAGLEAAARGGASCPLVNPIRRDHHRAPTASAGRSAGPRGADRWGRMR